MDHEIKGYNVWHEPALHMIKCGIDDTLNDAVYTTNYERLYAILNLYKNAIRAIESTVENTFRNFNGELDKLTKHSHAK
jgi:hypothetical protein